jgi:hypothetical protein
MTEEAQEPNGGFTQEQIDAASAAEQELMDQTVQQAQINHLTNRVVGLRLELDRVMGLLERFGTAEPVDQG